MVDIEAPGSFLPHCAFLMTQLITEKPLALELEPVSRSLRVTETVAFS